MKKEIPIYKQHEDYDRIDTLHACLSSRLVEWDLNWHCTVFDKYFIKMHIKTWFWIIKMRLKYNDYKLRCIPLLLSFYIPAALFMLWRYCIPKIEYFLGEFIDMAEWIHVTKELFFLAIFFILYRPLTYLLLSWYYDVIEDNRDHIVAKLEELENYGKKKKKR